MANWLIVESVENWRADRASGFLSFGLPQRKSAMARTIQPGDTLFAYVSGRGGFADVRRVTGSVGSKAKNNDDYDRAFGLNLPTAPVTILDEDRWIKAGDVHEALGLSPNPKAWPQFFRTSLRPITDAQAAVLLARLNGAAAAPLP